MPAPGGTKEDLAARLRHLPAIDRVMDALELDDRRDAAEAARRAVESARRRVRAGEDAPAFESIVREALDIAAEDSEKRLRPVLNATGVLIHTNLGRVPLGKSELEAVSTIASGYSNLEYDLAEGERGSRYAHAQRLLTKLTGAEAALVVNNNAAALLLVLSALCRDREVIISRGEMIEIGGEFRIPEVMALSGARLVEIGTTNRTHLADYERAISPETAAILKVHPSNYRVVGFTSSVADRDLGRLARGRGVMFLHDIGSGLIEAPATVSMADEPRVDLALDAAADLVTFSGDKLLGGPQAGVIVGRSALVIQLARHPLVRALRVDKMTLAALEATARAYLDGRLEEIPLWSLASAPLEELAWRAQALASLLDKHLASGGLKAEAVPSRAVTGGGSLPTTDMGSWAISITHGTRSTAELERALRRGSLPVLGRIEEDRLVLDLRAVLPSQDRELGEAVLAALT